VSESGFSELEDFQCELRVKTFLSNENNILENHLVDTRQMINLNPLIFQ